MFAFLKTENKWNQEVALESSLLFHFLTKSEANGAYTRMHNQAIWKVFMILTKKLKFYSDCVVQWIGAGFFKDSSLKTLLLRRSVAEFSK